MDDTKICSNLSLQLVQFEGAVSQRSFLGFPGGDVLGRRGHDLGLLPGVRRGGQLRAGGGRGHVQRLVQLVLAVAVLAEVRRLQHHERVQRGHGRRGGGRGCGGRRGELEQLHGGRRGGGGGAVGQQLGRGAGVQAVTRRLYNLTVH